MNTLLAIRPVSWIKAALYGLLFIGLFYSSHTVMIKQWDSDDYNYAYLIPAVILYLIWEKRSSLPKIPSSPSWYGAISVVAGIIFYLIGELGGEYYTLYLSSWLLLVGVCWVHLGWQKLKSIAFPLFFIPTMFPLPNFINTKITLKLQLISSQLGVGMIQLYGLSAYRVGNVIDLGFTQLQVVEACSGLRYLIPLLVLGILLAYFIKAALWKKVVLVISTIPISIFTNSFRIAMTGILYKSWGQKAAEGFFHDFSGWTIFLFSLGMLLAELWILKYVWGRAQSKEPTVPGAKRDNPGTGNAARESRRGLRAFLYPAQFVAAAAILGATLVFSQGIEFREKIPPKKSFDVFPLNVGIWHGVREALEKKFLDVLDLSEYVMVDFRDKSKKKINFYVAYYESQRKGESIHSPASCLPGGGWEFKHSGEASIPMSSGNTMTVSRAVMQLGELKQLVYYWYPKGGRVLTNAYQLKLYTFWDAITRQRTDGALVRLITPVYETEELQDAEERLQTFTRDIVPVLAQFVPD